MSTSAATRERRTLTAASAVATAAGAAAILADLALEYTPQQSALFSFTYQFLVGIPLWRLLLGHFVGLAAITLEIAGFWVVYRLARAGGVRSSLVVLLATAYCTVLGVAFHGSAALTALLVQARQAAPPDATPLLAGSVQQVAAFELPLAAIAFIGLAGWSIWYAVIVARGRTPLPRWLAPCNPLAFLLLSAIIAAIFPPAALVLGPTALNVSTTATFLPVTIALWRHPMKPIRIPAAEPVAQRPTTPTT